MNCACCARAIPPGHEERCWYCLADLCGACWERLGHCGHPDAELVNAQIRLGERPTRADLTAGWPAEADDATL